MILLPSDISTSEADVDVVVDEARSALLEAIEADLEDGLIASHLLPGKDLWIRVDTEAWGDVASYLRDRQRFRFFGWLSAIDWMPSPFGRSLSAEVDEVLGSGDPAAADATTAEIVPGYTGGDTRFQVIARVHNLTTNLGLTVKVDVPDDPLHVATWTHEYPGAEWHEREVWEMFGIGFAGHPGLRHLYLPGEFEGYPMRKDYPLLARLIKPWPGIVDVEPMPEVAEANPAVEDSASSVTPLASTTNPEDVPTEGDTP